MPVYRGRSVTAVVQHFKKMYKLPADLQQRNEISLCWLHRSGCFLVFTWRNNFAWTSLGSSSYLYAVGHHSRLWEHVHVGLLSSFCEYCSNSPGSSHRSTLCLFVCMYLLYVRRCCLVGMSSCMLCSSWERAEDNCVIRISVIWYPVTPNLEKGHLVF